MRHVLIYSDENGEWCASVPSLPGCYSQGETREEALANIKEAVDLHIESMIAHGEAVPVAGPAYLFQIASKIEKS
jgi:predicted RNase H-like HicB family nuclease